MFDTDDHEAKELDALGERFLAALARKERGEIDAAEDELRAILRQEPRLGEPRLELARILLDTDRLDDAEDHAREALEVLLTGGQWIDDLPEAVVQAIAHGTLAEILRRKADEDDVIFGDPEKFHALVREAKDQFAKAAALDPSDDYGSYHAFFLGLPGAAIELGPADAAPPVPGIVPPGSDGPEPGEA
ncbi:MAG: tetratricopeptide repeat protein [Myxococcota bacterium]